MSRGGLLAGSWSRLLLPWRPLDIAAADSGGGLLLGSGGGLLLDIADDIAPPGLSGGLNNAETASGLPLAP